MLALSTVEDLRSAMAPHLAMMVKALTNGSDRMKDLSLQILVNLTNDGTLELELELELALLLYCPLIPRDSGACRGEFRKTGVVPSLVTALASDKMSDYMREVRPFSYVNFDLLSRMLRCRCQ